jgi:deoxyribodipyrimidine photolyase-related protein
MKSATIIFPHQLFENHPGLSKDREVFLVEESRFFSGGTSPFRFHKKKLMFHRASMQAYRKRLTDRGYTVHYVGFTKKPNMDSLFDSLRQAEIGEMWVADSVDHELEEKLKTLANQLNVTLRLLPSPGFLSSADWLDDFFKGAKHFSMAKFYISQRKRLGLLLEQGKPVGGKWSFDPENRKKIPRDLEIPPLPRLRPSGWVDEAKTFVEKNFSGNPGTSDSFFYPVTHEDARKWLDAVLNNRLILFGDYQDAMAEDEPFLFHSILSPMINVGLLTPDQVIKKTLDVAVTLPVPLNSLEGFIRQIVGWREFIRAVYRLKGEQERTLNFFQHHRKLPSVFYTGETGLDPVDTVIKRLSRYAYAHHIERLMVLGNIMLLSEIDPDDVYRWFMEMFIDAYDWVMVPNVYGMSQHADGGMITTKPYISSSHYIRKMSDFSEGNWCKVWDGLYWRFIHKHRALFEKNPRMRVMTRQLDRMGKDRLGKHIKVADRFLERIS